MSVTNERVTTQEIQEAEKLEMDVKTIMRLVDLIFLCKEDKKEIPS